MKKRFSISILLIIGVILSQPCRATVVSYDITGLTPGDAYDNVIAVLKNLKKDLDPDKRIPDNLTAQLKKTQHRVEDALKPFGYFNADVVVGSQIKASENSIALTIGIRPGPVTRLTKASITVTGPGKTDPAFKAILQQYAPTINASLNTKQYQELKKQLYNTAAQRGYFEATMVNNQILIDQKAHQATISLQFNSGSRYTIKNITVDSEHFDAAYIKKFITLKPSSYYNAKDIELTKKHLINSDNFKNVIIQTSNRNKNTDTIDVHVILKDKKPMQYLLGAGYGTDTGVRGTLGVNFRHLNPKGQQLETLLQASQYNSSFTTTLKIPGNNPVTQNHFLSAGIGHINQDTGNSDVTKIAYSYVTKKKNWQRTLSLNALNENYDITDIPKTDAKLIYPNINWTRRVADNLLNPSRGLATTINLSGAPDFSTSKDTGFTQIRIDSSMLSSFNDRKIRLLLRNSLGRTDIDDLSRLPLSLQLFAGGSRSIRGYSYNSIGPGKNLVTGTVELQKRLPNLKSWYLAGFIDAGNVSDDNVLTGMKSSSGFGVVWLSPLGMVEFDLAVPLPKDDHGVHVSFSMGPAL